MSSGNHSYVGSSSPSRTEPTTGDSALGSARNNEIESLTRGFERTSLGTSSSSYGRTTRARNSTPSSTNTTKGAVRGMKPVAKKDMPYMSQTFVERALPMIENTELGVKTMVEANFFPVDFRREIRVYQYDIQYRNQKGLDMRKAEFTKQAFWYAYRQTKNANNPESNRIFPERTCLVYNGVNILWSTEKLNFNQSELQIVFGCDDGKNYAMYIKYATIVTVKPNPVGPTEQADMIQILDEVLTARVSCLYEDISHYFHKQGNAIFYEPRDSTLRGPYVKLGAGLEAWSGLHGAIKPNLQAGLLLNVDLTHSVFYRRCCRLVDFYTEVVTNLPYEERNLHQLQHEGMDRYQRKKLEDILKGRTLEYRMPNGRNKVFKFSTVAGKAANAHFFTHSATNQAVSIADYYQHIYNHRLQFPFLPCICINKVKNLWAPMEFIYTDDVAHKLKGKIPDRQLRTMVRETAYYPHDRKKIIMDMAAAGEGNASQPMYLAKEDDYMKTFGMTVDRNMVKINATLLPAPTLEFGQGKTRKQVIDHEHVGVWDLKDGDTLKKITNRNLTVIPALIFLTPNGTNKDLNLGPFEGLLEVLHNFGVNLPGGKFPWVTEKFDCYTQQWEIMLEWMRSFKDQVRTKFPGAIPLTLFVFPYKCTTRRQNIDDRRAYFSEYSMIKYICDVFTGIHCQGILSQTYTSMKGNPLTNTTSHNVAIKILGKIGATLYRIEANQEFSAWKKMVNPKEPVLIMGIDVTHPGEQDRREGKYAANSVACVVGNVDTACMQYEASVRAQNIGEERTLSIKDEVVKRLLAYEKNTGKKPAHIVVYRDGVSETQFQETLYEEKKSIQEACKEISPDYVPTLSYIIISKRHHTRFFPLQKEDTTGKAFNLKPGTLVESGCTTNNYFDFYLVSHYGPLGTSRPCHYYVLYDDWAPSSGHWQEVTFGLAYSYVRCPKSISQPAPVMYAHLAAKRAKDYLMAHVNMFGPKLENMTEYESFTHLRNHMQMHQDLKGMIFV